MADQTGDIYLVRLWIDVQGNDSSVGFHYQQTAGPTVDVDRTGALSLAFQGLTGFITPFLASQTRLAQLEVSQVSDAISGVPDAPSLGVFANQSSARPGDAMPLTKAIVCKLFQNDLPGRFNGRQYWPGFSEDDTDGNVVSNPAILGNIETLNDNARILSETVGGDTFDFQHVVWSPNFLPTPQASPIVDTSASPTIFSQRRRITQRRLVKT